MCESFTVRDLPRYILSLVRFGSSSSLERIGIRWIYGTRVEEVSIPSGVRELCDECFKGCKTLRRVTFGPSSLLERIGDLCFDEPGLVKLEIPPSVKCHGDPIAETVAGVPIHIKPLMGRKLTFHVQLTDTIEEIKVKIQDTCGLPLERQRLKFNNRVLEEGKMLQDYSIQEDSTLLLIELK